MGIHEYDRIRSKNRVQQKAYDLYTALHSEGLSDTAIATQMQSAIDSDPAGARNDIYSTVLKIVGRSNDNEEMSVYCSSHIRGSDSD